MCRALARLPGWRLIAAPDPKSKADAVYLSAYFEAQKLVPWPAGIPTAAYFTHKEEDPPGNDKAKLFDRVAKQVDLRVATCRMYAEMLSPYGPTIQAAAPLERERFVLPPPQPSPRAGRGKPVVGFSGFTYINHRKGEDLVRGLLESKVGRSVEWRASGRGWPVPTKRYSWEQMPAFYQSLDILVCPSRVEGIPMPPLEALACGVSVVVPEHVGIFDELPQVLGIHRYKRGDPKGLVQALEKALEARSHVDREALRGATEPYSVQNWCRDVAQGMEMLVERVDGGIAEPPISLEIKGKGQAGTSGEEGKEGRGEEMEPVQRGTGKARGIYCVAFGDPARKCALRMMTSAKKHMPDVPIALCAAKKIGPEDVLIVQPDSDVGGRRAKLRAYELSPAEWQAVLYLDADTEVVAPIYPFFEWIKDGWEFVICKDPHLMDTMHAFERTNNKAELAEVKAAVHTLHTLQINGGVWAFGRSARIAAFFARWQAEWERHAQRDQGALLRALYVDPLKTFWLGNEWNTFPKYCKGTRTAGLMHYPGDARRWAGQIPGRIDSAVAWEMVKRHEGKRG